MIEEITCWINSYQDQIRVGDEVVTTTSEIDFNSKTDCFDQSVDTVVTVLAEHTREDYSEYVAGKSNNGGCYGYDYWKVIKILEVN